MSNSRNWLQVLVVVSCSGLLGCGGATSSGVEAAQVETAPASAPNQWDDVEPWDTEVSPDTERPPSSSEFRIYTEPGELPQLRLRSAEGESGDNELLPLEHTHVKAEITGYVASVEVTQTYENNHVEPIEAVYVFPLPENSAVHDMKMVIGDREIQSVIKKRREARRIYHTAKKAGHTAALLEQERSNVFTQSVANIEPGKKIDVVVRYLQDLTYDSGKYEFVFPMVVGPRFHPGEPLGEARAGTGTKSDTTRVPDASRVSPPYVGRGERSGHDISIELVADAGTPITTVETPTHDVVSRTPSSGKLHLTLAEKDSIPNRDFVLRYGVAGPEVQASLFAEERDGEAGYFSLVVQPPEAEINEIVGRRELIFVVDVSGSMRGIPLSLCRSAMRSALSQLRPVDTFNIITFAGATEKAFSSARPASRWNITEALKVVDRMSAGGGTYMDNAVKAALSEDVREGRHRYVFFLTDGLVGNEAEIIGRSKGLVKALKSKGQRARVFSFGVGSSTNRELLEGIAQAGEGLAVYASAREEPSDAVNAFFHYIDQPVFTEMSINWGSLQQDTLFPRRLPDVFASRPVIVHGRFQGALKGKVEVEGTLNGRRVTLPVQIRKNEARPQGANTLGTLWARSKVAFLQDASWDGSVGDTEETITQLGLHYGLVTPYTSFIAVDRTRVVSDGDPKKLNQPSESPEGVDVESAGGDFDDALFDDGDFEEFSEGDSGVGDICRIDPAACPMMDMALQEQSLRDSKIMAVEQRRGCGCRAAGSQRTRGSAWWVIALAMGCLSRRWFRMRTRG